MSRELLKKSVKAGDLPKYDDGSLRKLLGEHAPKIDASPRGRIRLVTSLRFKFGEGYAAIPAVSDVVRDYDSYREHVRSFVRLKGDSRG